MKALTFLMCIVTVLPVYAAPRLEHSSDSSTRQIQPAIPATPDALITTTQDRKTGKYKVTSHHTKELVEMTSPPSKKSKVR